MTDPRPVVETESRPCPLGCAASDEVLFVARDRLHGLPGEFPVVRCGSCGLMRTNPRPTPGAMAFYYPEDYIAYRPARPESQRRGSFLMRMGHHFLNTERLPPLAPGRMLEVGCGSGKYLDRMALAGWQVEGIDASPASARVALSLGHVVQTATIEEAADPAHPYDLVVGWMVVEHLHDPVAALAKLARWAAPGAWLVVSVPNAGSLEFRLFKDAWLALDVPRHLFHFAPSTLGRVFEAGGWHLDRILHQRVLDNLVGSVGHVLEDRFEHGVLRELGKALVRFPDNEPLHWVTYPLGFPAGTLMGSIGQTGRMTVWARKPSA